MQIVLADLDIAGETRKVLMQAPKNGFFYVLDRRSGKLLSADNFVTVTWASRVDLTTGRPVEAPGARYYLNSNHRTAVSPQVDGGHSWPAMSFSPLTGFVYIPAIDVPTTFFSTEAQGLGATGVEFEFPKPGAKAKPLGRLIAWDPVNKKARWSVDEAYAYNGGTLATAGNLVFQGTAEGVFTARDAADGRLLWSMPVISATQAPPVTFRDRRRPTVRRIAGGCIEESVGLTYPNMAIRASREARRGYSHLLLGARVTCHRACYRNRSYPSPRRSSALPM